MKRTYSTKCIYLKEVKLESGVAIFDYTHVRNHEYKVNLYSDIQGAFQPWNFEVELMTQFLLEN